MRSVSLSVEVRDGKVEETERSEGDDMGLRVLVGQRQAVVSTNDIKGNGATRSPSARSRWRGSRRRTHRGARRRGALARDFPDLDLIDPRCPIVAALEQPARARRAAALAVEGREQVGRCSAAAGIGGMVLVTSHGFRGAYLSSGHGDLGDGDRRRRHRRWSATTTITSALHAADLDAAEQIGRSAGERAVKRLNPRKVETRRVPVVFDPRVAGSLVGHLASAINGASVARKTSFLRDKLGERLFRAGIRIVDDPLRRRGLRSHPFDGEGVAGKALAVIEDGVLTSWFLDCATARELSLVTTGHASRGVSSSPSPSPTNLHLEAGPRKPAGADRRHRGRLLRHRPDRHGGQSGHRRLQPRRVRTSGSRTASSLFRSAR